jgi:hypothetical protein
MKQAAKNCEMAVRENGAKAAKNCEIDQKRRLVS